MKKIFNHRATEKNLKGFTLIELMIVSVMSVIVIYGAIDFFNNQQKVFRQQSLQARNQANVRMALYYISRDLMNAGFSGGPFGVETAIKNAQDRSISNFPVVAAKSAIQSLETDMPRLGNGVVPGNPPHINYSPVGTQYGGTVDALEIWGNFSADGQATHLSNAVSASTSTLYATTIDHFSATAQSCNLSTEACTSVTVAPIGAILASFDGKGEYVRIGSVNTGSRQINTTGGGLYKNYMIGDSIAPVWRRVYYVRVINGERWLVRREYYGGSTAYIDTKIANGVWDLQVTFDMTPAYNQWTRDVDPDVTTVNPVLIDSVNVRLISITQDVDQTTPIKTVMMKKIKLVNLGLHPYLRGY
jgi:prepilin-type N-terminal cleavage/methylation domain-containing protein